MSKRCGLVFIIMALLLTLSACMQTRGGRDDVAEPSPTLSAGEEKEGEVAANLPAGEPEEIPDDPQPLYTDGAGVKYGYRTEGSYISIYDGESFVPTYLNGVNLGSGTPGFFPGELAIDGETYSRWFEQIAAMNCNCIRVYTTMMPCFYEAFYEYNRRAEKKLYLIMGIWYDEDKIQETGDAYDILEGALAEAAEQTDIIHGDCEIAQRPGRAWGTYSWDVSDYVLGWILGIESDAYFVGATNDLHPEKTGYEGEYLSVSDTDAFHSFLCELGDRTIAYETERYHMQRPVSWSNWPTADMMSHPEEPLFEREDAITINVELIKAKESFPPGLFASYHVYPYYPDFMMLEEKYTSHVDSLGKVNTYEAYLQDLISHHSIPVMIAEFGVPSSRGCTHVNGYMHYDQGHMSEVEQGEAICDMAKNIYDSGFCGGIVFTWQDEWFKRTWNTMDYTDPDRRPFWSDIQTSEQNYGILAFDPGTVDTKIVIDGNFDDWYYEYPLTLHEKDGLELYVQEDERYLYLCVRGDGFSPEKDHVVIPMDITPRSGSNTWKGLYFDRPADFVVDLNGREDSTVLVHRYYDRYAFVFGKYDDTLDTSGFDEKETDVFVPIYLCMNRTQTIPTTGEVKHAEHMDSGHLKYGCADPEAEDYDSLADFIYGEDFVEARIPWGLLNFRDPSSREVEEDFWEKQEQGNLTVDEIYIGLWAGGDTTPLEPYTWREWDAPSYHERLKKSYDIVGEGFGALTLEKDER